MRINISCIQEYDTNQQCQASQLNPQFNIPIFHIYTVLSRTAISIKSRHLKTKITGPGVCFTV